MANNGHIHHKNYELISRGLDLHPRNLDPAVHGGHTFGTTLGGCILEFTYPEGPAPSLITGHGHVSRPRNQRSMARNKLTQGMALTGLILLGNHAVNDTKGPVPAPIFSCGPDLHLGGLDPMIHDGHTLKTPLGGCILEFTYMGDQHPLSPSAIAKTSTQEAKGTWPMASSPKEWPVVATSFEGIMRSLEPTDQRPSPATR